MRNPCSAVLALLASIIFAVVADADPGTTWDKQIDGAGRFSVLSQFNDEAVLDKETGLVWEQSPETAPNPTTTQTWHAAQGSCNRRIVGGRFGWRLPTLQELASLVDPNNPGGNPDLPPGHPFSNVGPSNYWSATTKASDTSNAWFVALSGGATNDDDKTNTVHVWCVRGGQGVDSQ